MNIPAAGSLLSLPLSLWIGLLLNLAVKGLLLLAGAHLIVFLLRRQPAALLSLIWRLTFVLLLLLPVVQLGFDSHDLLGSVATAESDSLTRTLLSGCMFKLTTPPAPVAALASERPAQHPGAIPIAAFGGRPDGIRPERQGIAGAELPGWPTLLVTVWLLGLGCLMARLLRGLVAGWRVARASVPLTDPRVQDLAARAGRRLGLPRAIAIRLSRTERVPFIWGLRRSALILPAEVTGWRREALRTVLWHEFAHVRRHDLAGILVCEIARALLWFNPLAWTAARRARLAMERSCDDIVLGCGADGPDYARQLLQFAVRLTRAGVRRSEAPAMARRSDLRARLTGILDPRAIRGPVGPKRTVLAGLLLTLTLLPPAAIRVVGREDPAGQRAVSRDGLLGSTLDDQAGRGPNLPLAREPKSLNAPQATPASAAELHAAAAAGDRGLVGALLAQHPAWLEARDQRGMTALALAAWGDHLKLVEQLIALGADLDAQNHNGLTPLFCALDRGRSGLARLLIAEGADLETRGFRQRTLLHMASRGGDLRNVQTLLAHGADVEAVDSRGVTALELALRGGHRRVAALLRDRGARYDPRWEVPLRHGGSKPQRSKPVAIVSPTGAL